MNLLLCVFALDPLIYIIGIVAAEANVLYISENLRISFWEAFPPIPMNSPLLHALLCLCISLHGAIPLLCGEGIPLDDVNLHG